MKLATWNINSVRLRCAQIAKLIDEENPDIICLQETKTPDEHFPMQDIKDMGFPHIHIHGMKGYNGLAILSKKPFVETHIYDRVNRQDCRHIAVKYKDFELHNIYVPAGGDEPDRDINDKYAHKLDFVKEMSNWFKSNYSCDNSLIACGDFNIAPEENDVWSHKQLLKVVSHTPAETTALKKMQESIKWVDTSRHFVPSEEKCYTWWSYRNRDWKKSNRGRRLDHIWVTKPLRERLKSHNILSHARDWDKPSDHVPVIIKLKK